MGRVRKEPEQTKIPGRHAPETGRGPAGGRRIVGIGPLYIPGDGTHLINQGHFCPAQRMPNPFHVLVAGGDYRDGGVMPRWPRRCHYLGSPFQG